MHNSLKTETNYSVAAATGVKYLLRVEDFFLFCVCNNIS